MSDNTAGMGGLRPLRERVRRVEEEMAQLRHDLTVKPGLVERLVAIGYPREQAAEVVDSLPRETVADKVSLREGLATIDYSVMEIEDCMEDVPELKRADIDHARDIMEAWDPQTTAIKRNGVHFMNDPDLVVFPKIPFSNVRTLDYCAMWSPSLRYMPKIDTSGVRTAYGAFFPDIDGGQMVRLRRVPDWDFSSATYYHGGLTSFLPELEIASPLRLPSAATVGAIWPKPSIAPKLPGWPGLVWDPEKVQRFVQTFNNWPCEEPPITDFGNASAIEMVYAGSSNIRDWRGYTLTSAAPVVALTGLFQGSMIAGLPNMDFKEVSSLENLFAWCMRRPTIIPDWSRWKSVKSFKFFLIGGSNNDVERIEGLDLSSVQDATSMILSQASPFWFPALRYIRILNLGKGSCTTYDFTHARNWGMNDSANPDARKSLVDTLLTDSYDRTAAGLPPITVRLYSSTKARLTAEEKAAITAKGITLA